MSHLHVVRAEASVTTAADLAAQLAEASEASVTKAQLAEASVTIAEDDLLGPPSEDW